VRRLSVNTSQQLRPTKSVELTVSKDFVLDW